MKTFLALFTVSLLASAPAFAVQELDLGPGCPRDTDCCEFGHKWRTEKQAKVFATPGAKKSIATLRKGTDVPTIEGKFTPAKKKGSKDSWWVKVKLADGREGWVDGNLFVFESRCP